MSVVDIIIPVKDREHTIGRTVEAVMNQTLRNHNTIVVDDGSVDGTAAAIEALGYPGLCVILQDNQGPSAARNRGGSCRRCSLDCVFGCRR
jgi:glycosyltransferase involved in cell wall biosynthesis